MMLLVHVRWQLWVLVLTVVLGIARAPVGAQTCGGDCNHDGGLTVEELLAGLEIALGEAPMLECGTLDSDSDGRVAIHELLRAVDDAAEVCKAKTAVTGTCLQPGPVGLVPCLPGTVVRGFRCKDRSHCLDDPNALALLDFGSVSADGQFFLAVDGPSVADAPLVFAATVEPQTHVDYRVIDFGLASDVGGAAARGRAAPVAVARRTVVIDPSSEGSTRVVNIAGFDKVSNTEASGLVELTRQTAHDGADYANLSVIDAANRAEDIAFKQFFLGATSVTVSPDGATVYIAGVALQASTTDRPATSAVGVFARDPQAGTLQFVEVQRGGVNGVDGIADARVVALSPDGRYAYVPSFNDKSVAVFSRDPQSGRLHFVECQRNDVNGVTALGGPVDAVVSPDGAHVYVVSQFLDSAVAVFARDAQTGRLQFVQSERDGLIPLRGGDALTVSPDGAQVYVANGDRVTVFSRDVQTGMLSVLEVHQQGRNGVDGIGATSGVAVSPDGAHLYVTGLDAVVAFARDASTGRLSILDADTSGTPTPTPSPTLTPTFRELPPTPSSVVQEQSQSSPMLGSVFAFDGASGDVVISADGERLYAGGTHGVAVFGRDASTGRLAFMEMRPEGIGGIPHPLAVSPDGLDIYSLAPSDPGVAAFDQRSPALTFVQTVRAFFLRRLGLQGVRDIAVSPDGKQLYSAGTGDDAVGVFRPDPATGLLSFVEVHRQLPRAQSVLVSPNGANVYVGTEGLVNFARDQSTGALRQLQTDTHAQPPLAISLDGRNVYGTSTSALEVFQRDGASGALSFLQAVGDVGVIGGDLGGALTVSPDGAHVYAASQFFTGGGVIGGVSLFQRDPVDGTLSFVNVTQDCRLTGPGGVVVSPDGAQVYVGASDACGGAGVAVLARDPASGLVNVVTQIPVGSHGPGAAGLALSPDGTSLYFASNVLFVEDTVSAFTRDTSSGVLHLVETKRDGIAGVSGLAGARAVAISPDGTYVYVASADDGAVAVFRRHADSGALDFVGAEQP